ncbi:helix-turn-helix domain-containing protein [Xanthomonas maliensis]|uniref:helix-turn-helix domain-containing protein n=2 Tax=Xanthomonas maliensis TaxID=1321368 RepID=UPI001FD017C7|nr:helix-turn-helix domain-containing protein [Xanthomonas maliensis]
MAHVLGTDRPEMRARRKFSFAPLQSCFEGAIQQIRLGGLHVSKVAVTGHEFELTLGDNDQPPSYLLVSLQYKGASRLTCDGRVCELRAGELAVLPVHRQLRFASDANVENYFIWFEQSQLEAQIANGLVSHQICEPAPMQRLVSSLIERLFSEPGLCNPSSEPFLAEALSKLLQLSLTEADQVQQHAEPHRPSREMVVQYVERNLRDPELSPESIARALGWSKRTVYRAFKGDDGESLNGYLWRRRVEQCAQELRGPSNLSITGIAYSFGFSSSPHFSRLFKQHMGASPLRYRRGDH